MWALCCNVSVMMGTCRRVTGLKKWQGRAKEIWEEYSRQGKRLSKGQRPGTCEKMKFGMAGEWGACGWGVLGCYWVWVMSGTRRD